MFPIQGFELSNKILIPVKITQMFCKVSLRSLEPGSPFKRQRIRCIFGLERTHFSCRVNSHANASLYALKQICFPALVRQFSDTYGVVIACIVRIGDVRRAGGFAWLQTDGDVWFWIHLLSSR